MYRFPIYLAILRINVGNIAKGNSVGEVNELHQELKDLIQVKHGVSTRHLPGCLAWISYLKKTSYTIERSEMVEYIFNDLFAAKGTYPVTSILVYEIR